MLTATASTTLMEFLMWGNRQDCRSAYYLGASFLLWQVELVCDAWHNEPKAQKRAVFLTTHCAMA